MRSFLLFLALLPVQFLSAQSWDKLNREAVELYRTGQYKEAISKYDLALDQAIREFGKDSNEYLTSLSNKAYAQSSVGDYLEALESFRKTSKISLKLYPLPHSNQLQAMVELTKTHMSLANYDSADFYLSYAKNLYAGIYSNNPNHADTAAVSITDAALKMYSTEASLMHKKGQLVRSISLMLEIVDFIKKSYPEDYQELDDYRITLSNLSTYSNEAGDLELALTYARKYDELIQNDGSDLDRIHSAQNMGAVYRNLQQYDSAFYFWDKALGIINGSAFKNSYIHTVVLNNMGELFLEVESYEQCMSSLQTSLEIQESKPSINPPLYKTTLFNLAECHHWKGDYAMADSLYTLLVEGWIEDIRKNFTYLSDNEKMSFYQNQVSFFDHFSSFALEIAGIIPIQDSEDPYVDPEIPGRLYDLQLTTKAIILNASRRMRKNILNSGNSLIIHQYNLWEEKKYELAQALVNENKSEQELLILQKLIDDAERQLINGSKSFKKGFQLETPDWQEVQKTLKPGEAAVEMIRLVDGLIYGALILTSETKEQPLMTLVMSTRSKHLEKQFYQNYYNSTLYKIEDTLSYATYWKPIVEKMLSRTAKGKMPKRIYFSNDGIYNRINLNTLYDHKRGQYVIDDTEIVYLTSTKELLSEKKLRKKGKRKAALFGEPRYSIEKVTGDSDGSRSARDGAFLELPGTGKEVDLLEERMVANGWETQVFKGEEASEENLKLAEQTDILHIATHGYFDPDTDQPGLSMAETMIGSGIALAGVNDPINEKGDGLLTAFEMVNLNLDSTELVVLSACETGKGANHGEGVYGLQRAVRVAGAQNLIMSLWKVDDQATQKLMVSFYRNWIESDNMRQAFQEAQKELRKEYPDPYYWGAFVLAGR